MAGDEPYDYCRKCGRRTRGVSVSARDEFESGGKVDPRVCPSCVSASIDKMVSDDDALVEAIDHAEEVVSNPGGDSSEARTRCAEDHYRLAAWLRELRLRRRDKPEMV